MKKNLVVVTLAISIAISLGPGVDTAGAALQGTCWQQFWADMEHCSELGNWYERYACGLEAEVDLLLCGAKLLFAWS